MQTLAQLRKSIPAAIRGEVEAVYAELVADAQEQAERPNTIRRNAWHSLVGHDNGMSPFWRHGFAKNYGRRVERSDYTAVPGYDEIHDQIAREFPEFAGDDGEYRLFTFLFSPYAKLPERVELYAQAIGLVAEQAEIARQQAAEAFDFGANVCEF